MYRCTSPVLQPAFPAVPRPGVLASLLLSVLCVVYALPSQASTCALPPLADTAHAAIAGGSTASSIYAARQLTELQAEARDILAELININTTHSSGDNTLAAEAMAARFRAAGFDEQDVQLLIPAPRKGNLVVRYRGREPDCAPLLLLAHLDVVEADSALWERDPFSFVEEDGYLYGRGVSDDKDEAAIHVANLLRLKREGHIPGRDIVLALTADEEGGTHNGVAWLLEEHPDLLRAEYGLNEGGGGVLVGGERFANEVQATEKMYQSLELKIEGRGGHSSMPSAENVLFDAAAVLRALENLRFPVELNEVTRDFFKQSMSVTDGELRAAIAGVLAEPPDPDAVVYLESQPFYNASLRTTCVPTMISGGHAENALPQSVTITVNCRLVPTDSHQNVYRRIAAAVGEGVTLTSRPDSASPPGISLQPEVLATIGRVSRSVWPDVPTIPTMAPGGTDSRYLRARGVPMYGVNGIFIDVEDDRGHARNERIRARSFYEGLEFLYRLTKALAQ